MKRLREEEELTKETEKKGLGSWEENREVCCLGSQMKKCFKDEND